MAVLDYLLARKDKNKQQQQQQQQQQQKTEGKDGGKKISILIFLN